MHSPRICRCTLANIAGVVSPYIFGVPSQILPVYSTKLLLCTLSNITHVHSQTLLLYSGKHCQRISRPLTCRPIHDAARITQHVTSCGETSPTPGNHNGDDIFASTSTVSYSGSEIPKYNSWMLYQCPVPSSSGLKTG